MVARALQGDVQSSFQPENRAPVCAAIGAERGYYGRRQPPMSSVRQPHIYAVAASTPGGVRENAGISVVLIAAGLQAAWIAGPPRSR
jgi:hypothetical protein